MSYRVVLIILLSVVPSAKRVVRGAVGSMPADDLIVIPFWREMVNPRRRTFRGSRRREDFSALSRRVLFLSTMCLTLRRKVTERLRILAFSFSLVLRRAWCNSFPAFSRSCSWRRSKP